MARRHYITVLLLFVSILTLAVPVMPHHHHADGNICLRGSFPLLPQPRLRGHTLLSARAHRAATRIARPGATLSDRLRDVFPRTKHRFPFSSLSILFTLRRIPARHVSRTCQRAARPSCRLTPSTRCLQLDCRQKCVLLRAKKWEFSGALPRNVSMC